jgi:ABC-type nitrate/sulfonate/bicarbonate transport system substrate-binding protein
LAATKFGVSMTGRLPRWLRVLLVAAITVLVTGAGFYSYRYATRATTLTVAAGSVDGEAFRLMSAIAARLAGTGSPLNLKVIDKGTAFEATKAFAAGQADLVITRDDAGDLSAARTVLRLTYGVVLLVVPPGSTIDSMDALKGKTVGVIGGEINRPVVQALVKEYDLDNAKVRFRDVGLAEVKQVLKAKQIQALLVDLGQVSLHVARPLSAQRQADTRDYSDRLSRGDCGSCAGLREL